MAYDKKQNKYARTYHSSMNSRRRSAGSPISKAIIVLILVAMLIGLIMILMSFLRDPERLAKSEIESLTSEYYKDFYFGITDKSVLEKYNQVGLPILTARQLILHNPTRKAEILKEYCDENETRVRIFPESPYGENDYRVEYKYTCEF